jgi:protein-S-isoprenylcysteine O-methyltransferase Ste14
MKYRTVVHPNRRALPRATHLVTDGVFRRTRNPIYLGMAIILLAWMLRLENWLSATGPILFVAFIDAWQIRPEEALEAIFGEAYRKYKQKVRRWI